MSYYITSEYSQSYIYHGNITSLPYHVQTFTGSSSDLQSTIKNDLSRYLGRYFTNVELEVNITDDDSSGRINILIKAIVYEGKYKYSLGREIIG